MKKVIDLSLDEYMKQYKPVYKPVVGKISKPLGAWASHLGYYHVRMAEYDLCWDLDPNIRKAVKYAYTTLRKAIRAYRPADFHRYRYFTDVRATVDNHCWLLPKETITFFADWLVFPDEDLDRLFARADLEYEFRQREAREEEERRRKERAKHIASHVGEVTVEDACAVLGVNPPILKETIKQRYRALAKQHHPDVGGNAEDFIRIQRAYEALTR